MTKTKRQRDNKQQGMRKRLIGGKKPMSNEQKADQKRIKEAQREKQRKLNESKKSE